MQLTRLYAKVGEMLALFCKPNFKDLAVALSKWFLPALTAATLLITSHNLKYGFDFTDEAFYFNQIKWADTFTFGVTLFGHAYGLFHFFVGDNIHALRILNLFFTYSICLWLVIAASRSGPFVGSTRLPLNGVMRPATAIAISSVFVFYPWLFTPNYNALTFQGLVITSIGVVSLYQQQPPINCVPVLPAALFIGLGGTLTFLGKPSSAAALVLLVVITALSNWKRRFKTLALAGVISLLLIVSLAIVFRGGLSNFFEYLHSGLLFAAQLGGGHTPSQVLRLDAIPNFSELNITIIFVAGLAVGFSIQCTNNLLKILSPPMLILVASYLVGLRLISLNPEVTLTLFLGSVAIGSLVAYFHSIDGFRLESLRSQPILYFLALPWVFTFGTNGNYWRGMAGASFFWLLIPAMLSARAKRTRLQLGVTIVGAIALFLSIANLTLAGGQSYRQPPILGTSHKLFLSMVSGMKANIADEVHKEMVQFDAMLANAGFIDGTPILDLSGKLPGLIFLTGAQPAVAAWVVGGYPGSANALEKLLADTECGVLARSWIISQPAGDRSLPVELIRAFGASPQTDYILVGSGHVQQIANSVTPQKVDVLRPKNPQIVRKRCLSLKSPDR